MTKTNQAFIKVYRHDVAEPTPPAYALPAARPAATGVAASIEYVAYGGVYNASPPGAAGNAAALAGSIDVLGPPAQLAVDTIAATSARPRHVKSPSAWKRSEPRPWRIDPQRASKRPLSAFLARPHVGASESGPDMAGGQGPGTTVASFRWPTVCRVLARQFGGQLDRVAELICRTAHQGTGLIGILGLFPGSGCTTASLCLAERLAACADATILIDGNFCKPRLAAWLDAVPTAGWQEVLAQEAPLWDAIIRATDDHLDLLALSSNPRRKPAELAASPQTNRCAALLRESYGVGLVDLGTFFDARSQRVALELVRRMEIGAVIAVAGPSPADARDLATVADHLKQSGCELLGLIENRIAKPQSANTASHYRTSDV